MKPAIVVFVLSVILFITGKLDALSRLTRPNDYDPIFFLLGISLIGVISCVVYGIHTSLRDENKRLRACIK